MKLRRSPMGSLFLRVTMAAKSTSSVPLHSFFVPQRPWIPCFVTLMLLLGPATTSIRRASFMNGCLLVRLSLVAKVALSFQPNSGFITNLKNRELMLRFATLSLGNVLVFAMPHNNSLGGGLTLIEICQTWGRF